VRWGGRGERVGAGNRAFVVSSNDQFVVSS